jgi:hypothetical protein
MNTRTPGCCRGPQRNGKTFPKEERTEQFVEEKGCFRVLGHHGLEHEHCVQGENA